MARLTPLFFGSALILFAGAAPLQAQNPCAAAASLPLGRTAGPWQRWEQTLISTKDYLDRDGKGNPFRDLLLKVTFRNCTNGTPSGLFRDWLPLIPETIFFALQDGPIAG